ncbi:MAG: hypothetical protein P4L31_00395 [Candidatus Babeliales bacterium]|nr:hypothetical protein [Candidatus Babeliales bacterium]
MKAFTSLVCFLFVFSTISGSQPSKQANLADVKEAEKKLKVLESQSDLYKEHARLHKRLDCTIKEIQTVQEKIKNKDLSPDQVDYLQGEVSELNSRLFSQSADLIRFESASYPHLHNRANGQYDELKASEGQAGKLIK